MNQQESSPRIESLTTGLSLAIEFGKARIDQLADANIINGGTVINCIGAVALISSGAHALEKNYIRAAAWAGYGWLHLQHRPARR